MKKYILEITVFISWFIVLTYEVVWARILWPYYGTSSFVWTAMIGIILASLSVGYALGGKLADKKNARKEILSDIIFFAWISVALTYIIRLPLLEFLNTTIQSIRFWSVIAATILFLPASVFLGMVSPYAVKLRISGESHSGTIIWNMSALWTIGSILWTFITGFYLIPSFWVSILLASIPVILIILCLLIAPHHHKYTKFWILFVLLLYIGFWKNASANPLIIYETDTEYSHIQVLEGMNYKYNERVRMLKINVENHSSISLDSDRLINQYSEYYHLVRHFMPWFQHALMIGWAWYSFPKEYLKKYPWKTMDVVEIDPGVTEIAKKYFFLQDNPRLKIFHEDARVYLNRTNTKYDVIFWDAFTSWFSVPYQLTTKEAIQKQFDVLTDSGIVILNLASSLDGDTWQFLRSEYFTFKEVFPQVYLFPTVNRENGKLMQNIILIALKSHDVPKFISDDKKLGALLQTVLTWSITDDLPRITDDFAPVDYYMSKLLN